MAMTLSDIVSQMRSALLLSEPDLDTTVGTPTRKILDAVGEVLAEAYVDRHLLEYQYDIDAKSGEDLDEFVRLFGFTRLPAKRATGMVTFERSTASTQDILLPINSQISTQGTNTVVVQTVTPALLVAGETTVDVPVQALVGGTSGNVPANSLRFRVTPLTGVSSFTNTVALSGGADAESDGQLRARFLQTIFRNMAGTEHQFLATALNDEDVSLATVIGAAKRYREAVEVVGGTVTSTVQAARYVYPNSQVFGPNIDGGDILVPNVHYSMSTATPPVITILDSTVAPDGVYDLEFEYVPGPSRNDPANGITNRVDVYVNGTRATDATEMVTFRTARVFDNTANSTLNRANFQRIDASQPVAGNYFVAFSLAPVIDPAQQQTIVINGVTFNEGVDFFLVNDVTRNGGTPSSLSGIEIRSAANGGTKAIPADGTTFQVDYIFNAVPRDVEAAMREWRLITTDVRVHQAKPVYLDLHLAVVYHQGYSEGSVRPDLEAGLAAYISNLGFNAVVQVSDILEVAQRVPGIDAVRFLTSSDNATKYAIQKVSAAGTILTTYATSVSGQIRRALDVQVGDDEYPTLNSVTLVTKARNTFGAV